MNPRVAVVTCRGEAVDPDSPILLDSLRDAGLSAELTVWDDPDESWDVFDLVVVRSTWDYAPRRDEFLRWASDVPRLANGVDAFRWNTDKHYLADLERLGVPVISTTFADVGVAPIFPNRNFVVKPTVGAGSLLAERYTATEHAAALEHVRRLHERGRDAIVQPYIDSVDREGELALVFIDGRLAHAMRKGPMLNVTELDRNTLFRQEQMSSTTAPDDAHQFAVRALEAVPFADLLYARVDLVREAEQWLVMEIELTEPSLFLGYSTTTTKALTRAIVDRVTK